jgi:hypothetical protein
MNVTFEDEIDHRAMRLAGVRRTPLTSVRYAVRENLHRTVLIAWIAPGWRSLVSGRIVLWSSQGAKERQ